VKDITDFFDLERFVIAQDAGGTYARALEELRQGRKASHWMWFVFPQVEGLGHSATARKFAISSLDEARIYLEHEVLGPRLRECVDVVAQLSGRTAEQIFGATDALKLRSSMTLFARAAPDEPRFMRIVDLYFGGIADAATDKRLTPG
jgi:uncharacterized protein (DUF1810 family)